LVDREADGLSESAGATINDKEYFFAGLESEAEAKKSLKEHIVLEKIWFQQNDYDGYLRLPDGHCERKQRL
jgi:hypothetical protein